jgi:hypothetical protein
MKLQRMHIECEKQTLQKQMEDRDALLAQSE